MTCGIYLIDFGGLNKYIGCSGNIETRAKQHLYRMTKGVHTNNRIQDAFNGVGTPSITILEECAENIMYDKEIGYIDSLNTFHTGLNKSKGGKSGYVPTDSEKEPYIKVLFELAYTNRTSVDISNELNIGEGVVRRISSLTGHTYLKEEFPIEYALMSAKLYTRPKNDSKNAEQRGIVYPILVSPEGIQYKVSNVHQFSKDHTLGYSSVHKLLTGKIDKFKGWKRLEESAHGY